METFSHTDDVMLTTRSTQEQRVLIEARRFGVRGLGALFRMRWARLPAGAQQEPAWNLQSTSRSLSGSSHHVEVLDSTQTWSGESESSPSTHRA